MRPTVITFEGYDKYVLRGESAEFTFVTNLHRVHAVAVRKRSLVDYGDYYKMTLMVGNSPLVFDVADQSTVESIFEIWQDTQ